ncbi:PQQ-binding-like beta-propeller repeat protein [Streptomyces sp. NPDC056883]|uniref:outer membrane protein assembly factor BamB family protein n=1 Tax=Streptomyces sp. NPDC056883 TaxID=3345959 RepID=UPI0036C997D4
MTLGAVVASSVLTGCGGEDLKQPAKNGNPQVHSPSPTRPARSAFDPPLKFDGSGTSRVDLSDARQPSTSSGDASRPAVTLADGTAYVTAESGLKAIDTETGAAKWEADTKNPPELGGFGHERTAPLVKASEGVTTVLAAFDRTVKAQGTTPSSHVIEVLAVDATTGKSIWTAEFQPVSGGPVSLSEVRAPQVVAVDNDNVVVVASNATYVLSRQDSSVRWKQPGFRAAVLADGVVAGSQSTDVMQGQISGFAVESGQPSWTALKGKGPLPVSAAGPGMLATSSAAKLTIFDAATGAVRATADNSEKLGGSWICRYDEQSLVLCALETGGGSTSSIVVFNASSMQKLWQLPDGSGRLIPRVTAFWHGAAYGRTSNGSVVLDGKSGQDRSADSGSAPFEVDQYAGLSLSNGEVTVRSATG